MNLLHFDGTVCMAKRTMPKKSQIARYWQGDKAYITFGCIMDIGEPSCWGCGIWNEAFDIDLDELHGDEVFKVWDMHPYLERCHVIPKSLGGCCCEPNLVLLCKNCHKDSPDTNNEKSFFTWVRKRKSFLHYEKVKMEEALDNFGYSIEDDDVKIFKSEEFLNFYKENIVIVGGKVSWSTRIASLIEFKTMKNLNLSKK